MNSKYPFVLTIFREPGSVKPVQQRYSFETLPTAVAARDGHWRDRTVTKIELSCILDEETRHDRERRRAVPQQ